VILTTTTTTTTTIIIIIVHIEQPTTQHLSAQNRMA
jgi:hypothetical protein